MKQRILSAVKKEFLQFLRDKMLMILILWTYTVEIVVCAYALSFDVNNLRLAVYDQDRGQLSERLIERFLSSDSFGKAYFAASREEADGLLDSGKADLGLGIPPDFSDGMRSGRGAEVQVILSGVNSNTANAAKWYASSIISEFSREVFLRSLAVRGVSPGLPGVEPRTRIWYNPSLKFRYFMVISMIVVAGLLVGVIHIAATMVREKETGTIEQIIITPLKRHELIISKVIPTLTIGMLFLLPSLLIALWFRLPMKGSIPLFFLASALSLFSTMGIGIYVSTWSRNLQQALLISFFIIFPLMFLSGTLVPVESMPAALQYLSRLSPVRYYMELSLAIFLKGVGLSVLWPKFLALFIFGAIIFPLSLRRLKKRIYE